MNKLSWPAPSYPAWLEEWWLQRVVEYIPSVTSVRDLDALTAEVQQLSDLFIREGSEAFDTYDQDPRLLLAYGLFYFPQTFVRVQWPLQELLYYRGWRPPLDRPVRILDLGAGLGSASLGALHVLQTWEQSFGSQQQDEATEESPRPAPTTGPSNTRFAITAVDHASHSLQWFCRLARALSAHWPQTTWETRTEDLLRYGTPLPTETNAPSPSSNNKPVSNNRSRSKRTRSRREKRPAPGHNPSVPTTAPAEEPWDLIVVSFALNEMFREQPAEHMWQWLQGLLERLAPNGLLLLLEPASRDSCERLEAIRDIVAAQPPFAIWGPCLHADMCPLRESGKAWCHEVRTWDVPPSLQGVNRRLFHSIQALKFGYLALGHAPPTLSTEASPHHFRMIAPMARQKGRWLTTGCASHGELIRLEIFSRDLDSPTTRLLDTYHRGDIVAASELSDRSKVNQYRLPPGATLTRLHPEETTVTLQKQDKT